MCTTTWSRLYPIARKPFTTMLWEQLTWDELPSLLKRCHNTALLPVGATEQHGPHLALGTDSWIADRVCTEVAKRTGVPKLPNLPYGCSLGHSHKWPGTIALPPKVLIDAVYHIGEWAYQSGVRRLLIVNAHVTNFAPLRCALEMLRHAFADLMVAVINTAEISPRVHDVFFADARDWHANAAETALLLAHEPSWVREHKLLASDDPDRTEGCVFSHPVNHTSANGVTGNPSRATRELGEHLLTTMIDDLSTIVQRAQNESIPFDPTST
jgi:creatinine amidohydrolase